MPLLLIAIVLICATLFGALIIWGKAKQPAPTKDQAPQDPPPAPPQVLHAHLVFSPLAQGNDFVLDPDPIKNTKLFEDILARLKQRQINVTHTAGALIAQLVLDGIPFVLELEELSKSPRHWHIWLQSTITKPATQPELDFIIKQLQDSLVFLEVTKPQTLTHDQWNQRGDF